MKKECMICCGEKKDFIQCQYCNEEACVDCQEKYILDKIDPSCMSCKKSWTYNWIREKFPKNFINKTYKKHKENQIFEVERTLLPEIQNEVSFEMKYTEELEFYENLIKKYKKYYLLWGSSNEEDKKLVKEINSFYNYSKSSKFLYESLFNISKKWEKEKEKDKDKYFDKDNFFNVKYEIRNLKTIRKNILNILENKVDFNDLLNIFGNMFYSWNVQYNIKTNTITGNLSVEYKESIYHKFIESFFLNTFKVEVEKNKYEEKSYLQFIFYLNINSENKLILDFMNKEYIVENSRLFNLLLLNHKNKKTTFSRPCPVNNCRGFFTESFECGLCHQKICKNCHELKDDEHKCNEDNVKSVKALQRETKPCPKCKILTFKQSGCSQIWCTQCHCTWDWESGEEDKGRIHNPHYWEYLRKIGKDEDEVKRQFERGGVGMLRNNNDECFTFQNLERHLDTSVFNIIFQKINHLELVDLPKYRIENMENLNLDLRKDYLKSKIDESKFKFNISKRFKKNNFNIEGRQILEMFLQTTKDTISNFFLEKNIRKINTIFLKYINTVELYNSLKTLQEYTITNLKKICENYDYILPKLDCFREDFFNIFNYIPNKEEMLKNDINHYTDTIDFLLTIDYNYNLFNDVYKGTKLVRYQIRNPRYFMNDNHFNEYKEERLNYFMDILDQLKKF